MMMGRFMRVLLAAVALIAAGCATVPRIPVSYETSPDAVKWPSEDLRQRVEEYWSLRALNDSEKTFPMEAPYLQQIVPPGIYRSSVTTVDQVLKRIIIIRLEQKNSHYYEVVMRLVFETKNKTEKKAYLTDKWVLAGGAWYHVIKDPVMRRFFP